MKKFLTSFDLKVIALISMTIDHIGYFLFPQYPILRIIGRLALPLYCFLTSEAYRYTSNKEKYFLRMFIMGCVMEVVLRMVEPNSSANIFLTLSLGFLVLYGIDKKQYLFSFAAIGLALAINVDYSFMGCLLIPMFYYSKDAIWLQLISLLVFSYFLVTYFQSATTQYYCLIACGLIYFYNHQKGYSHGKYFFYLYYPLHIVVLVLIAQYL